MSNITNATIERNKFWSDINSNKKFVKLLKWFDIQNLIYSNNFSYNFLFIYIFLIKCSWYVIDNFSWWFDIFKTFYKIYYDY